MYMLKYSEKTLTLVIQVNDIEEDLKKTSMNYLTFLHHDI